MTRPIARLFATRASGAGWLLAAASASALAAAAADLTPFDAQASVATLTYTIQIDGEARRGDPGHGEWSSSEVHRRLQGTLHLRGQRETFATVDNPQEQIARAEGA